ncbi:MAG: Nuclear protein SET [Parcubacteria group bacterium Gr01-1014_66]|nr:MAG: Nuclear protein SET [Parcubacteria group bacterium Gr01-1014_66]
MLLVKTKIDQSSLHGIGLFADEFIAKGTAVWRFTPSLDIKLTEEKFMHLPKLARDVFIYYGYHTPADHTWILPFNDSRFFNHSRNPNVGSVEVPDDQEGIQIALRDIKKGEELLCDYREFDVDSLEGKENYI